MDNTMKKKKWIMLMAITTVVAGAAVYIYRKRRTRKQLAIVSEAGYETAYDIHFPLKYKSYAAP